MQIHGKITLCLQKNATQIDEKNQSPSGITK